MCSCHSAFLPLYLLTIYVSLVPVCLGKGQWLARQIQSLQRKRSQIGVLEWQSVMNTSEYFSDDESDDSFHTSLDGSVFSAFEDMESDGTRHSFYFNCIFVCWYYQQ